MNAQSQTSETSPDFKSVIFAIETMLKTVFNMKEAHASEHEDGDAVVIETSNGRWQIDPALVDGKPGWQLRGLMMDDGEACMEPIDSPVATISAVVALFAEDFTKARLAEWDFMYGIFDA